MYLPWNLKNDQFRLDIVSLFAVIGESAMSAHSQPLTASILCLLPRILPAPQALLRHSRPSRLPAVAAHIVTIHSGTLLLELNHFASLIVNVSLPPFAFREIRIKHKMGLENHLEDVQRSQNRLFKTPPGVIHVQSMSPLALLSIGSFLLSVGLGVYAIRLKDWIAVFTIVTISLTSTIIGMSSLWHPTLTERKSKLVVPDGDLVVRTRQGAFIVVRCTEEVTRELFTGTEECSYVLSDQIFRALVGVGTFLLMISVVSMGNSNFTMQAALGGSYLLLNGLYQIAALFPKKWQWNLSRYDVEELQSRQARTFTQALWLAIRSSGQTDWVRVSHAAPNSAAWDAWIDEAGRHIRDDTAEWDAQEALQHLLRDEKTEAGMQLRPSDRKDTALSERAATTAEMTSMIMMNTRNY